MIPQSHIDAFKQQEYCDEVVDFLGDCDTWREFYERCPRGDWLIIGASWLRINETLLAHAGCDCAELALRFVPDGEERPRHAIDVKRRHLSGTASDEELSAAWAAAWAAA